MPRIDVMDSTWIPAPPEVIAPLVADPASWPRWWPGLELAVDERRGAKGVRWTVAAVRGAGDIGLTGTAEVWLQPMFDGVVAHFFLRLDPAPGRSLAIGRAQRIERDYRRRTKRAFWALADRADPQRAVRAVGTAAAARAVPGAPGSV